MKGIYRDEKIYIRNMQKELLVLHLDNESPMKGATMLETLTEARLWVKRFVEWYNKEHHHS